MPELIFTIFFGAVSVLALIYYILLMFVIGFAFNFTLFWPVLSAVCAFAAVSYRMVGLGLWHIRPGVWIPLAVIGVTVLAVVIYLEIVIVSAAFRPTGPERAVLHCSGLPGQWRPAFSCTALPNRSSRRIPERQSGNDRHCLGRTGTG